MEDIIDETVNPCEGCPDYDAAEETCRSHGGCATHIQATGGIYEDMIHRVFDAWEEMMKLRAKANAVIINGRKYGKLADFMYNHTYVKGPTLFGLHIGVDMTMPDDFDFIIGDFWNPPMSDYDELKANYDRLKEKYEKLKEHMSSIAEITGEWG